ncbi:hopanoid biosynthesis-associated protein HpnK [Phenylobacterium montanum]|uniref:Hopanoid biosynthesis-associated protein HpnK n=1 Tax=Phenylobacterium montanum TaxID=2823693 RepID=A0A975IWL2_9CAUL|nr:hopanoid biosynthesis-associated protein HpnK [Caulobacter sp. S6]QUD89955.1 hopanoid biosynthesis-associated protein HpnK [Caulobacter sp. S6]
MKHLVITSDDFGASLEVNEAVEQAHTQGALTAASLMVAAPGAADAVERARRLPNLGVGLHVVLVEGRPALPPEQVPALVDSTGHFRTDMVGAGVNLFFNPAARAQLLAEVTAQFEAFAATGLRLDHVNAHKHFHLHPTIAGAILKVGKRFGMRAARLPIEPRAVLAKVEPGAYPANTVVDLWAGLARDRFRRAGVQVPDSVFGLAWSGAVTAERLAGMIAHLPEGLSEIYLHPATGSYSGSAPGYRYADELAALLSPAAIGAAADETIRRGRFMDFLDSTSPREPVA